MTPYHHPDLSWVSVQDEKLWIYGRESFFSQNDPSILATRATSFSYQLQTKLDFEPVHYSQTAGAGLYYDSNNWIYAYVGLNDKEDQRIISILQAKLGQRIAFDFDTVPIPDGAVPELRWQYHYGRARAFYRLEDGAEWTPIADAVDVSYLSDEGSMVSPVRLAASQRCSTSSAVSMPISTIPMRNSIIIRSRQISELWI